MKLMRLEPVLPTHYTRRSGHENSPPGNKKSVLECQLLLSDRRKAVGPLPANSRHLNRRNTKTRLIEPAEDQPFGQR